MSSIVRVVEWYVEYEPWVTVEVGIVSPVVIGHSVLGDCVCA